MTKRFLLIAGLLAGLSTSGASAQNKAIDFKPGMPFSGGYVGRQHSLCRRAAGAGRAGEIVG